MVRKEAYGNLPTDKFSALPQGRSWPPLQVCSIRAGNQGAPLPTIGGAVERDKGTADDSGSVEGKQSEPPAQPVACVGPIRAYDRQAS